MNQINVPKEAYIIVYTVLAAFVWTLFGMVMWVLA